MVSKGEPFFNQLYISFFEEAMLIVNVSLTFLSSGNMPIFPKLSCNQLSFFTYITFIYVSLSRILSEEFENFGNKTILSRKTNFCIIHWRSTFEIIFVPHIFKQIVTRSICVRHGIKSLSAHKMIRFRWILFFLSVRLHLCNGVFNISPEAYTSTLVECYYFVHFARS